MMMTRRTSLSTRHAPRVASLALLVGASCASDPEPGADGSVVRVMQLAHQQAGQLVLTLPLMRPNFVGASVTVDERRNALIVRGPASAVDAVCGEIEARDVREEIE